MEQNLPIVAKKFWKRVRVLYVMLRKGISKGKLFHDLHMMMKRGKLAGKAAIHNLMFHHHNHHPAAAFTSGRRSHDHHPSFPVPLHEYEFSCSNSPATFHLPFNKRNKNHPSPPPSDEALMAAALEIFYSAAASPALPGFGPSPMVRQLRITDSPFPLNYVGGDSQVDEAAEEFIMKFYRDLRRQTSISYGG